MFDDMDDWMTLCIMLYKAMWILLLWMWMRLWMTIG